jgi:hypothetical protein
MSETEGRELTSESTVKVRRAPKYPAFIVVGGAVGAIVSLILTSLFPVDAEVGFAATYGYFALYGVTAGVTIGAIIAIVIDRVTLRRAKSVTAEQTTVEAPPVVGELED